MINLFCKCKEKDLQIEALNERLRESYIRSTHFSQVSLASVQQMLSTLRETDQMKDQRIKSLREENSMLKQKILNMELYQAKYKAKASN